MSYVLRPYQVAAVEAGVRFFLDEARRYNAIEMLPTGSGKSLCIAGIAKRLPGPVLIFQPSKEILEQNLAKYESYGYRAGVYSASFDRREITPVTFATIGSVKGKAHLFIRYFKYIIIDECHGVNAKNENGMYTRFLHELGDVKALGLTATPYRLVTDGFGGSILKFLTRTRPRVFKELIYYVQNGDLFRDGYLAKLKYTDASAGFDRGQLKLNSTGADYDDDSVARYYAKSGFMDRVAAATRRAMTERKNVLIFTRFVEDGERLMKMVPGVEMVTAESTKREREAVVGHFRLGITKAVVNCNCLAVGFDYPELETVILARPTMSLALYYQQCGRGIRPHPEKEYTEVIDLCGNYQMFGKVEDLKLVNGGHGMWYIESNGTQLTNIYYGNRYARERKEGDVSGPLDNCGLRREVVYADKEVVDMLEDKDAELARLRAETKKKDALLKEARDLLISVNDMFTPFVRLDGEIRKWRRAVSEVLPLTNIEEIQGSLARLREKKGGRVLCETCADKNQCSGVGSKKTECAIYREGK